MDLKEVLSLFGIMSVESIEQINKSAWSINQKYILKKNTDLRQLAKSISLSDFLLKAGVPAPKYLKTLDEKNYIQADDFYYCLMQKINGHHFDPYEGNAYKNGCILGEVVANLHLALKTALVDFDFYDSNAIQELSGWVLGEITNKNIPIPQEIIHYCYELEAIYLTLPRQLIHRDMHLENMLFYN